MLLKKLFSLFNRLNEIFESDYNNKKFLVFFRCMIALIAMIEMISLAVDLPLLFSSSDTVIPQELLYLQTNYFKYLYPFYQFLKSHDLISFFYSSAIYLYAIALFFMLIGLFTRYAAGTALILYLIIFKSFSTFNYGFDNFLTMSFFYCLVFPVGKYYSIDSKIFKKRREINFNYRRVLQIHLAIVYFFAGMAKGLDVGWWNGNSIWRAIISVDNSFYSIMPVFLVISSVGTVLLEGLYPFIIFKKITRKYALTAIILMHASIAVMMGLYAFSAIMITWNIAAFSNLTALNQQRDVKMV